MVFPIAAVLADGPPAAGPPAVAAASAAKLKDYTKELAKVSPRDAEGFYQFGLWCEKEGLHDKAALAYEQAIRIDPDHPQARAALGYRPLGTDWTKGPPVTLKPPAPESPTEPESTTASAKKVTNPAGPSTGTGKTAEPKAKPVEGDTKAEAAKVEDQVQAKKRWAQEAMGKLELKFTLYEDEDFLIHSTCEAGSPRLKDVTAALKQVKKLVSTFIGRPRPIWPGKLHFIYMRASTECMRFSEAIDGQRFPEEEGWYTAATAAGDTTLGEHTVFSGKPPEKALGFLLGSTALDRLGNSDRFVGWWLREGIASLVAGSTEEGKRERLIEQAFRRTAAEIEVNFEGVSIFKLIESEGYTKKAGELSQAEALTLVAFLYSLGQSKLQKLVEDLKSSDAPARPEGDDKLFLSQYARFQENAINASFHEKLEKLNDRWKAFVIAKAAEVEKSTKADPKAKTQKTTNAKTPGGKTGGKAADSGKQAEKRG